MNAIARTLLLVPALVLAAACEQIAVIDGSKARDADAVAVGSACRHSGRALEDCFAMYPDSPKAQVFAGWKEMNDYMTSNKMEVVSPTLVKGDARAGKPAQAKPARPDRDEVRVPALPPTSAAATDPLAGLPKIPAAADKGAAKPAAEAPAGRH